MKILLIHQYFLEKDDGGGSRFNEMTKEWTELGHEVTVLAGMVHYATGKKADRYRNKWFFKDQHEKVNIVRCHVSEAYNVNFIGRMWAYFSFVFSSIWAGLFKTKGKFDVIVVTSPPLFVGITAYVISKIKRIPFAFEIRDLWPESAIDTGVLTNKLLIKFAFWFENFIYERASLINTLTPAFQKKLIEEKKVSKSKVIMLPNAADFQLSDELLKRFDAIQFKKDLGFQDKCVITYVGAHGVANHLIQLVDAAELLKDTSVIFQLIGSGMQKDMLVEETKKRGLENIVFRDPVSKSEVFKYILASDIGTSVLKKVDTFKTIYSNKTFDYMACKKPILLLIDGVSRELVENAECGLYAEPENSLEIEKVVRKFLDYSNDKLSEQGENGYSYAKKHFDRKVIANKYLDSLNQIIK
ncbi:glycosyltransferase family 4 protein [bacterium SCSIO 12643]|nr:glycosyltransferase family 4 protein [bacterium SCSIO 12643]